MGDYKHYIRVDSNNIVIDGYADWQTEKRSPDEIPLSGEYERHFQIQLMTDTGQFKYKLMNGQMVDRTQDADYLLAQAKMSKIEYISQCRVVALETFQSSALGPLHTYLSRADSHPSDMLLLSDENAFVKTSDYDGQPIDWFTEEEGNVPHSAAQINRVYLDARSNVSAQMYKAASLEAQVNAATTADAVNAIVW